MSREQPYIMIPDHCLKPLELCFVLSITTVPFQVECGCLHIRRENPEAHHFELLPYTALYIHSNNLETVFSRQTHTLIAIAGLRTSGAPRRSHFGALSYFIMT